MRSKVDKLLSISLAIGTKLAEKWINQGGVKNLYIIRAPKKLKNYLNT